MRKFYPFLLIILIISVSFIALIVAIEENTYDLEYYVESFKENNIESITGKNNEELKGISKNLINYLKGNNDESLLLEYFNDTEITHMKDVYDLYELARTIKLFSAFLAIIIPKPAPVNKDSTTFSKGILFASAIVITAAGTVPADR